MQKFLATAASSLRREVDTAREALMNFFNLKYAIILSAIARIILQTGMPIYMLASSEEVDMTYVEQVRNLFTMGWISDASLESLTVAPGFSFFLAMAKALSVPYMMAVGCLYAFASILFFLALRRFVKSELVAFLGYLYILFSPIMFDYNMSRVNANAIVPALVLILVSCYMVLFMDFDKDAKGYIFWDCGAGVALGVLWITKKSNLWLGVLAILLSAVIIFRLVYKRKLEAAACKKLVALLLPVLICVLLVEAVKMGNYNNCGVSVISCDSAESVTEGADLYGAVKLAISSAVNCVTYTSLEGQSLAADGAYRNILNMRWATSTLDNYTEMPYAMAAAIYVGVANIIIYLYRLIGILLGIVAVIFYNFEFRRNKEALLKREALCAGYWHFETILLVGIVALIGTSSVAGQLLGATYNAVGSCSGAYVLWQIFVCLSLMLLSQIQLHRVEAEDERAGKARYRLVFNLRSKR